MRDLFSALSLEKTREIIKGIFLIVLARIQGSLLANQQPYIDFLSSYFEKDEETLKDICSKINEYIASENEDPEYKDYETEFLEFNDCTEAIKTLKD